MNIHRVIQYNGIYPVLQSRFAQSLISQRSELDYTIRLIRITYSCLANIELVKHMHFTKFCQTANSFELLYRVLYEPISKLYIYKNSAVYLSDCRITFFFLQDTGIEKLNYFVIT